MFDSNGEELGRSSLTKLKNRGLAKISLVVPGKYKSYIIRWVNLREIAASSWEISFIDFRTGKNWNQKSEVET